MKVITLDRPQCDWLTVTGDLSTELVSAFDGFMNSDETITWEPQVEENRMQYRGQKAECALGSIFWGTAVIKYKDCVMMQVSGELAESALRAFYPAIEAGHMKVTRLDLQVTRQEPPEWEQIRFLNRMQQGGKKVAWLESYDKSSRQKLVTVAIGSRTSEVYTRVYEKITNGGTKLLRYEVEYKGDKARAVAYAMKDTLIAVDLKYQLQRLADSKLEAIFMPPMIGIDSMKIKPVVIEVDKKAEWLLSSCLPAFTEVINRHGGDGGVCHAFLEAIKDAGFLGD